MNGWARNSRFWKISPWVVLLSVVLAMYFDDPATFIAVAAPWITVAGGKSIVSTYRGTEPVPLTTTQSTAPPMPPIEESHEYEGDPPGGEA